MFEEAHENFEGLCRLFAGQASPAEAERVATHLKSCRECWLLATRAMAHQKASGGIAAPLPLQSLVDLHEMEKASLEEGLEAMAAWPELRSLSPKARREKVRLSRALHTLSFLEALLEEGTTAGTPADSEEFFYLAALVAAQLSPLRFSVELKNESLFQEVIAGDLEQGLLRNFFLDLAYLFGFHLRRGQSSEAIAVCRRASQELSLLDDDEGSGEAARDQMRRVWRSLEEEVKKGNVGLGATTVLRNYIKAHWRTPANDPPFVRE